MIGWYAWIQLFVITAISISEIYGIYGGVPATPGEFPSLVYIRFSDFYMKRNKAAGKNNFDGICVGSIRTHTQIVTAAHCVEDIPPWDMMIVAGAYNITRGESTQQLRNVLQVTIHPEYHRYGENASTTRNDIAVLTIEPLVYNNFVTSLRLPPNNHQPAGLCWVAGWGETENSQTSDILLKTQLPVVETIKCTLTYPAYFEPNTQLCAGRDEGGYDACVYDTGGPLICNDLGYQYVGGIVSWGYLCARPGFPGVYTKVSRYIDWIPN